MVLLFIHGKRPNDNQRLLEFIKGIPEAVTRQLPPLSTVVKPGPPQWLGKENVRVYMRVQPADTPEYFSLLVEFELIGTEKQIQKTLLCEQIHILARGISQELRIVTLTVTVYDERMEYATIR